MLPIGSMRLHDAVDPALDAGRYRITTRVDTRDDARQFDAEHRKKVQHLEITGPRFTLEPGDIVSRHPPRDAVGGYGADLAHVVLGRRTLPWERQGLGAGAPLRTPWLALLLLREDEAELEYDVPLGQVIGRDRAARHFPDPDHRVSAVTVTGPSPEELLPTHEELPLLAHAREVNVADTALAGRDDDGWFAVVVGNRVAVGGEEPGRRYLACLVSLEERDDLHDRRPDTSSLVVLHSWRFTSTSGGGTFRQLIRGADRAVIGEADGDAERVGELGHVVLDGTDRDGHPVRGAYRGPLVPRGVAEPRPAEVPGPDGTVLPDQSLELARELGRLLGAADGRFLREVREWERAEVIDGERRAVARAISGALAAVPGAASVAARASAPRAIDEETLPALAGEGALQRVLAARLPAADAYGVPEAARAAVRRARGHQKRLPEPPQPGSEEGR